MLLIDASGALTQAQAGRQASPAVAPIAAMVQTVLARPLFSPTRRPTLAAPAVAPAPRLVGTIVETSGERLAILSGADEARSRVLHERERSYGLLILNIAPGRVLAASRNGRLELVLSADASRLAPTPSPTPAFVMTKDPRSRAAENQDE